MSGSMKDALEKSGAVNPQETPPKPATKWRDELPDHDDKPYVPFEAPARTKPKPSKP